MTAAADTGLRPLRILDLRDSPWVDGPGRTVLETAEAFAGSRHEIIIGGFCSDDVDNNVYLSDARQRGLRTLPIIERRALDLNVVNQILMAIDELGIDLLHTHDFRSNLAGLICARRRKLPVVSTCHGWIANNFKRGIYKRVDIQLLRRFERVITVSTRMKDELVAAGIRSERIQVIVNALVVDNFRPAPEDLGLRASLDIPADRRLIVNIGRLSAEKGQALLLRAFAALVDARPAAQLVFVGIGPEERALKALAAELGIASAVTFAGYRSDMPTVYNGADLVVQSSFTEGMPNVILEALLMKTPVLATDVGGTAEVLGPDLKGLLIEPHSLQALRDGMQDFLANHAEWRRLATAGRERIVTEFNHDTRVKRFRAAYDAVLSGGGL